VKDLIFLKLVKESEFGEKRKENTDKVIHICERTLPASFLFRWVFLSGGFVWYPCWYA